MIHKDRLPHRATDVGAGQGRPRRSVADHGPRDYGRLDAQRHRQGQSPAPGADALGADGGATCRRAASTGRGPPELPLIAALEDCRRAVSASLPYKNFKALFKDAAALALTDPGSGNLSIKF